MRILLNNREEDLSVGDQVTVSELLAYKRYAFPNIIIKINGTLVRKEFYASATIVEGDRVEMIHMVSGG